MANDYCTAADIKAALVDTPWGVDTTYDALLASLATAASREIDRFTGREPGAYKVTVDATRYYDGSGLTELWIDELAAAPTSVAVAETGDPNTLTSWAASDYLLWPYNALQFGQPYLRLDIDANGSKGMWYAFPKAVKIVGKFGYTATCPPEVQQATIIQAVRRFKRAQQAYRDVGAIQELGQLQYVKALDPDVKMLVEHLRRLTL